MAMNIRLKITSARTAGVLASAVTVVLATLPASSAMPGFILFALPDRGVDCLQLPLQLRDLRPQGSDPVSRQPLGSVTHHVWWSPHHQTIDRLRPTKPGAYMIQLLWTLR